MRWIKLDSTASTNSYVTQLLAGGGDREELVVMADYQASGRGQGQHVWHSARAENVLMSILLFPAFLSASAQFQLSRVVSLSLCDLLGEEGLDAKIKWPNDILINRRKVAGILIENGIMGSVLSHSIIGIGLNVNQRDFPIFPRPATSLMQECGRTVDRELLARRLLSHFERGYGILKRDENAGLERAYLSRMFLLDEEAGFRAEGEVFRGIIRGVNAYGELLIERGGKEVAYGQGQISFL